jgi:hypothetical protein
MLRACEDRTTTRSGVNREGLPRAGGAWRVGGWMGGGEGRREALPPAECKRAGTPAGRGHWGRETGSGGGGGRRATRSEPGEGDRRGGKPTGTLPADGRGPGGAAGPGMPSGRTSTATEHTGRTTGRTNRGDARPGWRSQKASGPASGPTFSGPEAEMLHARSERTEAKRSVPAQDGEGGEGSHPLRVAARPGFCVATTSSGGAKPWGRAMTGRGSSGVLRSLGRLVDTEVRACARGECRNFWTRSRR